MVRVAHCKTQLAIYKAPCIVEIRESLPKTAIGKIPHRVLREALLADFILTTTTAQMIWS